jgi:toxin ParE1/3/4
MPKPVALTFFEQDVNDVLDWSEEQFGAAAAARYAALIRQALKDVQDNPVRLGAAARPELAPDAYVYHLRHSRDRTTAGIVKKPRHFVLYRYIGTHVEFARLLHDSRDLAQHLPL